MKSPCVAYPENEYLVLIRASQVRICEGNHCAAALLSYFGYWHSVRLDHIGQAEHANKVAALHGEMGIQETTLLQYHKEEDIEAGLLNLYGRKTIRAAIALLIRKKFLSLHANPNPRYRFDKTHYFLFHPDKVQREIGADTHEVKMPHRSGKNAACTESRGTEGQTQESLGNSHEVKMPHREGKSTFRSGKNASPIAEITSEITSEITPPPLPSVEEPPVVLPTQLTPHGLMDLYNAGIPSGHPRAEKLTDARRKQALVRLRQFPEVTFWQQAVAEIAQSPLLLGQRPSPQHPNFKGDFDFLLGKGRGPDATENCIKIVEGKYRDNPLAVPERQQSTASPLRDFEAERRAQKEAKKQHFLGGRHGRPAGQGSLLDGDGSIIDCVEYRHE